MPAGTITALRAQERDPQRVNVFIDGEFAIGVSLTTITREGLFVGKQLDQALWLRLEHAEASDRALHAALRLLETRPRAIAELRERLRRKQLAEPAIESALQRLAELNLIDDAAFARFWVENRQNFRPRGTAALRDELRRKGVPRDLAEQALDAADTSADEPAHALRLARVALPRYADARDRNSFQRRLGGYLQRRGFAFETIRPILDTLWHELRQSRAEPPDAPEEEYA